MDDADPTGPTARFARLPLPDAPEGRIMLIRHLTPEAIWQDRFLHHANRAVALEEVMIATEHPAESAARFSRLAGRPVEPDPAGGFVLPLSKGRVRLLPPDGLALVLPGVAAPTLPFIAGVALRTDDAHRAIGERVRASGVAHRPLPDGLLIPPEEAGGAALLFRP